MDIREQIARKILDIPDIKEALSLLELKREGKLYKLADNQTLPRFSNVNYRKSGTGDWQRYDDCEKDMLKVGFKKVESI